MKKSIVVKIVLVMMTSFIMLVSAGRVFAADNSSFKDLTLDSNNVTENKSTTTSGNGNSTTGNTTNGNNTAENNVLKTNNTSNYNNSTLPKTGIEGTASAAIFVVVLGISAVYAYKKVQYYKNI